MEPQPDTIPTAPPTEPAEPEPVAAFADADPAQVLMMELGLGWVTTALRYRDTERLAVLAGIMLEAA